MVIDKQLIFLIIDDAASIRRMISFQLHNLGIDKVFLAASGAEALRILKSQRIDIILSDWNMPVMTGLELLKLIRTDERLQSTPFIMITEDTERDRVIEAISFGVSDLLVKPYNSDRLYRSLEKAISWKPRKLQIEELTSEFKSRFNTADNSDQSDAENKRERLTILIVDDTADNLTLLSNLFQDEYEVRVANSGSKALNICFAENNRPDLVLLDVMMPGLDGFEVALRMREHPRAGNIPIIFVTALTTEEAHIKGLELGAIDFVRKPVDPNTLKPRVRNFIRHVKLGKKLQEDYDNMIEVARLHETVGQIALHDMKTPLLDAINILQKLTEDDAINRKHLDQLGLAEEKIFQAINVMNLSSEIYKIETKRFDLKASPTKINNVLQRVIKILRRTTEEKQINIVLTAPSEPIVALCDSMLCYSIFQTLLKNACDSVPKKSRINVTIYDEKPLRIMIKNREVVPLDMRSRFFDKFLDQDKQVGIVRGSYAAKLLTEAQHGQIKLDVSDDENTTAITVYLPRATLI